MRYWIIFPSFTLFVSTVFLPLNAGAADRTGACSGDVYEGAWFSAQLPPGMTVEPVRTDAIGDGALSVWMTTQDQQAEFFVYAPQWGGTPFEIFLGATERRELIEIESPNRVITHIQLTYEDAVGRYTVDQSFSPASHLAVGYRTATGSLTEANLEAFLCFKESIEQFAD
ncbi:MAG: hypothetical protein AAF742_06430 [Pseudomonadota bacterium]